MTNSITITGNLSTDPQIRYSREGVAETTLTVSVDQAEGEPGPDLVTVICHGELAENVCLSLVRHARIVASGRLLVTSQSFEDVHPVCASTSCGPPRSAPPCALPPRTSAGSVGRGTRHDPRPSHHHRERGDHRQDDRRRVASPSRQPPYRRRHRLSPGRHHLCRHRGQRHGVVLPRIGSSARRHDHHRVGRRVVVLTREPVDASYCRTVSTGGGDGSEGATLAVQMYGY